MDARTDVYALGARALPGDHRQGALPARDRRGDDARAPRLAAAVGAERAAGRVRAARRGGAARDGQGPATTAIRRRATSAARARAAVGRIAVPETERSVAAGDASPRDRAAPLPLPPALAVETGRGPFVGREELLERLAARFARGQRRAPVRPAGGRARDRQDAAGDRVRAPRRRRGRDGPLRALRPGVAPPVPAVHHRAGALRRPPRDARPAARARGRADRARALRPAAAPPRAGARARRSADEPETRRFRLFEGVNRMLAFAARERPVVLLLDDLHWADASTTLLLGHLLQDAAPMRLLVSAPRGRSRASCSAACAGSGRSSRSCCPG